MYFTEGPLRKFERMMQEKPRQGRESAQPAETQDCEHCVHIDEYSGKCSKEKCVLLDDEQNR